MKQFFFALVILSVTIFSMPSQASEIKSCSFIVDFDTTLFDKNLLFKWQLLELNGQSVATLGKQARTPYIQFDSSHRVFGNNGCNQFFGTYELENHQRIKFSSIGSTLMACLNKNTIESEVMDVIVKADSYVMINDTLVFNKARMAPLARWVKRKTEKITLKKK
ncbi:MAG: META domain-containing protein [Chitinophagia bacterium]|nr:META domain-containing protein [Chitinophagia bacterium]